MKLLLAAGVNPNMKGGFHDTPLQAACFQSNIEIAKLLLEPGAKVDLEGESYTTALIAATAFPFGRPGIVKLLIDAGAGSCIDVVDIVHGTALQNAAHNMELVKILLGAGADVNKQGGEFHNPLQAACCHNNNLQVLKLLLKAGAQVNVIGGAFGTALQAASYKGDYETVKLLLEMGAEVNAIGGEYGTALQAASYKGGYEIVKLLLEAGAEPNVIAGSYGTSLQAACYAGDSEIAGVLIAAGAKINTDEAVGKFKSALGAVVHTRCRMSPSRTSLVKMLLKKGADTTKLGKKSRALISNLLASSESHGKLEYQNLDHNLGDEDSSEASDES